VHRGAGPKAWIKGTVPRRVEAVAGGVPIAQRGPGWTYRPDTRAPTVYGLHQPGIATPQRAHLAMASFDLCEDLHAVLERWTELAEAAMREGATVTIGLGPGAVPPALRPAALKELPAFPGDALDPALCGGDLCVLVGADAPPDELIARFGTPRWVQHGRMGDTLGFRDGTLNLRRPRDFDRHVWVTDRERSWMVGGTFLVMRRIVVEPSWHALAPDEQERVIGRDKATGAPLGRGRLYDAPHLEKLPTDSHIRLAAPRSNEGKALLRRGYATEDGLLFLAFQRDPRRQFVPIQQRLARHDALARHTRHVASAVFAIPPGARPRGYVGDTLKGY
jgi:deferrochelatase/peroxidase EfeB